MVDLIKLMLTEEIPAISSAREKTEDKEKSRGGRSERKKKTKKEARKVEEKAQ